MWLPESARTQYSKRYLRYVTCFASYYEMEKSETSMECDLLGILYPGSRAFQSFANIWSFAISYSQPKTLFMGISLHTLLIASPNSIDCNQLWTKYFFRNIAHLEMRTWSPSTLEAALQNKKFALEPYIFSNTTDAEIFEFISSHFNVLSHQLQPCTLHMMRFGSGCRRRWSCEMV